MVTMTTERQTASASVGGVELRAEAVIIQLEGQGKGVERINAFYRQAAEVWLRRCAETLPATLAPGRYAARYCCTAEMAGEEGLTVRAVSLLCRRGRAVAEEQTVHHWTLPRGLLLPELSNFTKKKRVLLTKVPKIRKK